MAFIELNGVHKYYDNHHVLKDDSLSVETGQVVVLIGRSGSGKSSLLRTINGMAPIDEGEISVDGTVLQADKVNPQTLRLPVHAWHRVSSTSNRLALSFHLTG